MNQQNNIPYFKTSLGKKQIGVLLDPDKINWPNLPHLITSAIQNKVSYFLVGGSLITDYQLEKLIRALKVQSQIPVILFPGSALHVSTNADAILFLSLISGRNSDFLIGQHVISAPIIKKSNLQVIPTGYMLIESGQTTTAQYMSNTSPIPANKPDIAACTALAGEMLGLQCIYLDAGSGARQAVNPKMITAVKSQISIPLIVGGGIKNAETAKAIFEAGADVIIVGNKLETNPEFLDELGKVLAEVKVIV